MGSFPTRRQNRKSPIHSRVVGVLALLALLSIGLASHPQAQQVEDAQPISDPVFQIDNLLVKGTGQGSADARARAIELAHIAGLRTIVNRLTSSQDRFSIRLPELAVLTSLVEEVKIKDQRLSETSLVALMDMRFSKDRVKAYLASEGISFSLAKSKPVLVVPVLRHLGVDYLWDDRSPWFRIWQKSVLPTSLIEFQVPYDSVAYDDLLNTATSGDTAGLKEILAGAKAGAALVTTAEFEVDADGGLTELNVSTRRYGGDIGDIKHTYNAPVEFGERPEDALADAAKAIALDYSDAWRDRSATQIADEIAEIEFESPIEGLDGWLRLEANLRRLGLIERIDLIGLDDERVEASIQFNGSLDQLSSILATQGLDLLPSVNRFILIPR